MEQHAEDHERPESSKSRWRWVKRPAVWIGSLVTAVVTAVAVSLAVLFANHVIGFGQPTPGVEQPITGPKQSATGAGQLSAQHGLPVVVASERLLRNAAYQGNSFVFSQPLNLSPTQVHAINEWTLGLQLAGLDNYYTWARAHQGIDPNATIIQLVLAGNRNQPVRILGMQPVGECRAPLAGTLLYSPPAGQDSSVSIGFNLDKPDPAAQVYSQTTGFGADYFASKTVSLRYQEQQVFQVVATTAKHYCEFRLQLTVLAGGKTSTETIGNGVHPFEVTSILPSRSITSLGSYRQAYIGGVASPCSDRFVGVDPATFNFYPPKQSYCKGVS